MKKTSLKIFVVQLILFCGTLEFMARIDVGLYYLTRGTTRDQVYESVVYRDKYGAHTYPYANYRGLQFNRYGFNDSDDYTYTERAHRYRVMVLGDSIAMGSGYTRYGNWPDLVEKNLQQQGYDVEVVNAAIASNSLVNVTDQLRDFFIEFKPDLIIIQKDVRSYIDDSNRWDVKLIWPLQVTKNYSALTRRLITFQTKNDYTNIILQRIRYGALDPLDNVPALTATRYRQALDRLLQITSSYNIPLVTITEPLSVDRAHLNEAGKSLANGRHNQFWIGSNTVLYDGLELLNNTLLDWSKEHAPAVSSIDLRPVLTAKTGLFADIVHYNDRGNRAAANEITRQITPLIRQIQLP